jgi:hypothetical protein
MYRIRTVSGQERVYPSIQELTAGVQRGDVTAEAEIYHQRTERWLSIESHPHFRMALEGSTATRTSRLKFTRPSSPVSTSGVRPTPAAQKPDQGDLEELNRLLVLLDPLPTPAQRAEPAEPVVKSPPDLTLVRPEPVPPPEVSADSQPIFGTMLRLEDLEPIPAGKPVELHAAPLDVVRDERIVSEPVEIDSEDEPAPAPVESQVMKVAPSDLGLPIEIHLDELPVPVELDRFEQPEEIVPVAESVPVPFAAPVSVNVEPTPVLVASAAPVAFTSTPTDHADHRPQDESAVRAPASRRARPMLFVAAAAILAAVVYLFTAGGSDPDQGMVTLASATAPTTATTPTAPIDSTPVAPASNVGFPVPAPGKGAAKPAPADSAPSAGLLPSAPTIDLGTAGAEEVSAGTMSRPSASAGSGSELARGYARSYQNLQGDFAAQMDRSGMVRLFSQTQLTTSDGLSGARRALDAAATAVRQYHGREAAIEKAYQDSARAMERNGATPADLRDWMTHTSLKESREAADEGARLIGQIDAVFALLQAQSGRYKLEGGSVRFDNADAGTRYAELQGWITRRLEHWSGQPSTSVPTTVQPLLEGIGLTRLPVSR